MNLFTIPPGAPFLDRLASWWLERAGGDPLAAADGLILLPTRRAARALTEAFLRAADGRALLLPRIAALGGLDEAPLALAGALDLPPAVEAMQRLAVLARMVMALDGDYGAPATADSAWRLAQELADLLDEAHRARVDLAEKLPQAAEAGYAEHWARTIEFLQIVTRAWPGWLRENGLMDAAARAVELLEVQATAWETEPPAYPVVMAGTTGGVPAVARLIRVVARLPLGSVILPGLDLDLTDDVWAQLEDSHPQAGMRALLSRMGASRGDVEPFAVQAPRPRQLELALSSGAGWGEGSGRGKALAQPSRGGRGPAGSRRAATLWRALLPAAALADWRLPFKPDTAGLYRLEPADQQEEAVAIALALRHALDRPHARAALVTPDRELALRVAAELGRYGIVVDDSAGEPLADTPPAAFLRLLARAIADRLAPVALLSVLKHPLAAFGLTPAACRRAARALERSCLRGPAPPPGVDALRAALAKARPDPAAADLLDRLEGRLAPLLSLPNDATPSVALRALIETAEAAASTDREPGAALLWAGEEGDALATHLTALAAALPILPAQPLSTLPGLLDASMQGAVVRSRRALRGRGGVEHPRVAILGLLEARLQTFDLVVLGSLAESVWPPATDPGPWVSRPMRTAAGLTSPEEGVGQMAHDFAMAACAAETAILSCPKRRDGAPAVPARWLVRLEAFLAGHGSRLAPHPAALWARMLDQPSGGPAPVQPPRPRPPVAARPRKLSVTEIETWLRDPYAIYAKHVLRLRALDPIEQTADAADYGDIVHKAIAAFIANLPPTYPPDAVARLRFEMNRVLDEQGLRPALAAWWRPRLARIADWVAETEQQRRAVHEGKLVRVEVEAEWPIPGQTFILRGRADRIERGPDGKLTLLDYKTGTVPKSADVEMGYAPQLPLEAAMAAHGAFGAELAAPAAELAYWHLTGGFVPGEICELFKKERTAIPDRVDAAAQNLAGLVTSFDNPAQPYLSRPNPAAAPRFSDYRQLARVAEWALLEDES